MRQISGVRARGAGPITAEGRAVPTGPTIAPGAGAPGSPVSRLIYLMLFRVGLVSILLVALFLTELALPGTTTSTASGVQHTLLITVIGAYGLTLIYAMAIRYVQRVDAFAAMQVIIDLLGVSLLVLFTGAPDSTFGFAYLLVIVGASTVLPLRGSIVAAACAILLYVGVSLLSWNGIANLEDAVAPVTRLPLAQLLRPLALNVVAMLATSVLAVRLSVELQRASERIDSQRISLHDLATLHREVIQSLQSGLISVDLSGRIATLNAAASEILGIAADAAVGRPVADLLPGIGEYLSSADLGAIVARMELSVQVQLDEGPAERTLGVTVSRLVNHRGQLIGRLINFQDLTDLRRAEESAKQADRLAVIGRMAATVAHEIRNPLAAICGSIELLAQMVPQGTPGESQDLMQIVVREGKRLDGLITELLSYASPRPLERTSVELSQEVHQMVQVFEHDRRLHTELVRTLRADTAFVEVDIHRLRQVMWNLLRNAAEANPKGPIDVSVVADAERALALLIVRDYGPGIPEEARVHLFEPFFTTKETGTGLGLATVHRIIEEHGGHVEIRNVEDGKGAEAIISLPLGQEPPAE